MRKRHRLLILAISLLFILVILGTIFFKWAESWSYIDSIYFTAMTVTTIGYGDLVPSHDVSKMVASFYAVISIPLALFAFGIIAEEYIEIRIARLEKRVTGIMKQEREMRENIKDHQNLINKNYNKEEK